MDTAPVKYPAWKELKRYRGPIPDMRVALMSKGFDPYKKLRSMDHLSPRMVLSDAALVNARVEDDLLRADNVRFTPPQGGTVIIGMLLYRGRNPVVYVPNSFGPITVHEGIGLNLDWHPAGIAFVGRAEPASWFSWVGWFIAALLLWACSRK